MGKMSLREMAQNLSCVILAAGGGTRMKPISLKIPKALSPIVDKPIIERILEGFLKLGIKRFIIVVKSEDDPIKEYFLKKSMPGDLKFAYQSEALGSGHALRMAEAMIETSNFFVSACDNIVPFALLEEMLGEIHEEEYDAVLSLQHENKEGLFARSVVGLQGRRVVKIIEKPSEDEIISDIMCLPLYLCRHDIFSYLNRLTLSPRAEYELPQAFQMMINEGKDICGVFTDRRFDLTTPKNLLEINWAFLREQPEEIISSSALPQDIHIKPPVFIDSGCTFGKNCWLGPYVVIGRNSSIGSGVRLKRCLVFERIKIPAGHKASDRIFFNNQVAC